MSTPNQQQPEITNNIRLHTTLSELTKTGTIDAAKILIRNALLQGSVTQHYDHIAQEKAHIRAQALDDEKVHYSIHLVKSFLLALGCERTWETFLLEMDLEDDRAAFDHKDHFHFLTHDVKPLRKEYDVLEGRLAPENQTPEPYQFADQSESAPYGALYSFVSDAWQTKQELNTSIAKEQCKQVEGVAPEQVKELFSFMKLNKENLSHAQSPAVQPPTPSTPSTQQHSQTTPALHPQQHHSTPNGRKTTTARTTTASRPSSPARSNNTTAIVDPGNTLAFGTMSGPQQSNSQVGTSFLLPSMSAQTSGRPFSGSRPSSPARSTTK